MKRGNAQYLDCGAAVQSTVIHVYTLICILKKILQNFHQRTQVLFTFIFDCLNLSTHFFHLNKSSADAHSFQLLSVPLFDHLQKQFNAHLPTYPAFTSMGRFSSACKQASKENSTISNSTNT